MSTPEFSRGTLRHEFRPLTPIQEDPQEYVIPTEPSTPVISTTTKDISAIKISDIRAETPTCKNIRQSEGCKTNQKETTIEDQESKKEDKKEMTTKDIEKKQKKSNKVDTRLQEPSTKKSIQGKLKANVEVLKRWLQKRFHIV